MYYGWMQIGIFGERKKCDQLANKYYEYAVKLPFLTLTLTESRKNEKKMIKHSTFIVILSLFS